MGFLEGLAGAGFIVFLLIGIGALITALNSFHKVAQGTALIKNGLGGSKVYFTGAFIFPIIHRVELIDLSVKRVEIDRQGKDGLICRDNLRADLKVAFFVRVNSSAQDVLKVAQSIGCRRASDITALVELFDAKFSEALKTVGKKFDFVELYTERQHFKEEIIEVIGRDLNGYVIEDVAIDYLEQTAIEMLNPNNILDSEGIKKIADLTAKQMILANEIQRHKEMTIVQQDVKAREAILELQRQQAEAEQKQKREIISLTAREEADAKKIQQEELLKSERARIQTEEEIMVATENKDRQIVVARKSKERTEAVESERVERDRMLEINERERIVTLAQIDKTKVIETEQRNIQETIKERVQVQRSVVEEEERIKDTHEIATADRFKKVQIINAEMEAEQSLVKEIKKAEAARNAAEFSAQQMEIEWEAQRKAAEKEAETKKLLALGHQAEAAAPGIAEAIVIEKKASALQKEGEAQAMVLEKKAFAEAKGMEARAAAMEKEGTAHANVLRLKAEAQATAITVKSDALKKKGEAVASVIEMKQLAEAKGIIEKANAMKLYDQVGRDHEEFKLKLKKDKAIELAELDAKVNIASSQAMIVSEALKSAKIEIVGGEAAFFDKIISSVTVGKSIEQMVDKSKSLTSIRDTFFTGDPDTFKNRFKELVSRIGIGSEDIKNLTVAALLGKFLSETTDSTMASAIKSMLSTARELGIDRQPAGSFFSKGKSEVK